MSGMLVQILIDNPDSYILPFALELAEELNGTHSLVCKVIHEASEVVEGDILFLLSCRRIFKRLELNKHNIVIHASSLPKGRGWSPLTWQILAGKNQIAVTLFEAVPQVDAGKVYLRDSLSFEGHELLDEMQHALSLKIIELARHFIAGYPSVEGQEQTGEPSYYSRRSPADSELNPAHPIAEQLDLLRVCDNENYPAFFRARGKKYIIKIFKEEE